MDDLTFDQMMTVMQNGHQQTMDMLEKLIELKRMEKSVPNEDDGNEISD